MAARWSLFGALVLLVGAGIVVYLPSLRAPFVYDDAQVLVARTPARYADLRCWDAFSGPRSLTYYTYGLNYRWGELGVVGYHVVNLGVHVAASGAVFWLVWLLGGVVSEGHVVRLGPLFVPSRVLVALGAGLLFAVHPLQTEGVIYLSARAGLLAALFYSVALASYCSWRLFRHWWWLVVTLGAALCAVHSKETAYTFPLALGLFEFVFFSRSWWGTRRWVAVLLLLIGVVVGGSAFLMRGVAIPSEVHEAYSDEPLSRTDFLLTQQVVKAQYLRLLVLPYGQSIDHDVRIVSSPYDLAFVAASVVLVVLLGVGVWSVWRGERLLGVGILFWFLALLPVSSVFLLPEQMVEYRLYLPMVGVALAGGGVIRLLLARVSDIRALSVVGIVLVGLAVVTFQRAVLWRDPVALWDNAAVQASHKARPYVNKGVVLLQDGRLVEAERALRAALRVDPEYKLIHHNLGVVYKHQGDLPRALSEYEQAIAVWPENALAHFEIGSIFAAWGNWGRALPYFERAVALGLTSAEPILEQVRARAP